MPTNQEYEFLHSSEEDLALKKIKKYQSHSSVKVIKVACRVQIWKKTFYQNKFCYNFIKNDFLFMYLLCIYEKIVVLSLYNIDTLNFTMYILTNLTCPLETYVIRLHNLISVNIFFTIKDHNFPL